MSVLETPRIYFKGEVTWDPIVSNNYADNYAEAIGETVLPAGADKVVEKVKAFRGEMISQVTDGTGNWNPHGTHRVVFYNSAVSAVDLGAGPATADPLVSAAVQFTGMLVDLEPFGAWSSQIYFDSMRFGIDGGYRIFAPRTSRFTARYINFFRNLANQMIAGRASVVWQTSFAKRDGLRVDAFNSPALQRLAAALDDDDVLGLTVRFNAYRTIYFDDPTLRNGTPAEQQAFVRLADKLTGGGFQPNPARSLLVGVVGLWRKGEPAHEPGDRVLCAPGVPFTVASAFARLDDKTLTLDLSNSVPENAVDLSKQDLGPLTVEAVDAAGHATSLGTISPSQYGRDAYVASAGIVVIPLAAGAATAAAGTTLRLRDQNGGNLLVETALRAIPDMPNRYLGEGDDVTATFQLYDRGVPKAAQVPITVYKMSANGRTIAATSQMATDANGILSIPITGAAGMIFALVLVPQGAGGPPTGGINTQVNTYMYVRVLPADANVGMMAPTWDNVYAHVLANWNAMAPCMDNWLMLDDPVQVKARAAMLKQLTDPANFENLRFMPITRDMTKGERTLLYKFLDAPGAPLLTAAAAPPPAEDLAALSRSMRRPPGARRT